MTAGMEGLLQFGSAQMGWGCDRRGSGEQRSGAAAGSASDSAGSERRGQPRLPFSPPATPRGRDVRLRQGVNPLVTGALTTLASAAERRTYDMTLSWHGMVGEKGRPRCFYQILRILSSMRVGRACLARVRCRASEVAKEAGACRRRGARPSGRVIV